MTERRLGFLDEPAAGQAQAAPPARSSKQFQAGDRVVFDPESEVTNWYWARPLIQGNIYTIGRPSSEPGDLDVYIEETQQWYECCWFRLETVFRVEDRVRLYDGTVSTDWLGAIPLIPGVWYTVRTLRMDWRGEWPQSYTTSPGAQLSNTMWYDCAILTTEPVPETASEPVVVSEPVVPEPEKFQEGSIVVCTYQGSEWYSALPLSFGSEHTVRSVHSTGLELQKLGHHYLPEYFLSPERFYTEHRGLSRFSVGDRVTASPLSSGATEPWLSLWFAEKNLGPEVFTISKISGEGDWLELEEHGIAGYPQRFFVAAEEEVTEEEITEEEAAEEEESYDNKYYVVDVNEWSLNCFGTTLEKATEEAKRKALASPKKSFMVVCGVLHYSSRIGAVIETDLEGESI